MVVVILILCALVVATVLVSGRRQELSRRRDEKSVTSKVSLSWPSKQLLKEYNALPAENRPFDNIRPMLEALDVKHGPNAATNHFYNYYDTRWDNCDHFRAPGLYGKCPFDDYLALKRTIDGVAKALADQKHALALAQVQHNLDEIKTLTERMRQEKEIITSVTKELM